MEAMQLQIYSKHMILASLLLLSWFSVPSGCGSIGMAGGEKLQDMLTWVSQH
jgi:hypothetical protein